ncbi:hypothetical protein [Cereibacter johrii]|uniref:GH16 domain-containing protein n=1 Tax=Cereibacter johrii TaxID=445629 RepID=A0ABX5JC27_9RHOB|nr:hypothetical protein [Cereibacter johrii]ODM44713.1 hypothetical protein A9O63_20485 [Cereibacter johrii]PTM79305.1 hypothetical protein C8J29_103405 [Cereibacter johrii]
MAIDPDIIPLLDAQVAQVAALEARLAAHVKASAQQDADLAARIEGVQAAVSRVDTGLTAALGRIGALEEAAPPTADLFEDGTGTAPRGWTQVWHALSWIEKGGYLQAQPASGARTLLACDALNGTRDLEMLALFTFAEAAGYAGLALRASGAAGAETGYRVMFSTNPAGPSLQVARFSAGVATGLSNVAFARSAAGDYWLRVRLVGATLSWKAWARGAAEPADWTGSLTDPSPVTGAGWAGICASGANVAVTLRCQQISWAVLPRPADTGTAAETLPWDLLGTLPLPVIAFDDEAARTVHVPPGQRHAHVKVTADQPIRMTAIGRPSVSNVNGGGMNVGGDQALWVGDYWAVWRPGDDREMWLTVDMQYGRAAGNRVAFSIATDMGGWRSAAPVTGFIEIREGAVNALPATLPRHRAPMRLTFTGSPRASLDPATVQWSDTGFAGNAATGTPCWRARLAHGYTQDGNGEVGLYMNADVWPTQSAAPHARVTDRQGRKAIRLRSCRLPAPVTFAAEGGDRIFYHQASALIAQNLPEWRGKTGVWTARCMTASRLCSWPAFWLLADGWPPELDIFEHFNGIYGSWPDGGWSTCTGHSGPYGGLDVKTRTPLKFDLRKLGFASFDAYSQIHDYAAYVDRDWIYAFVDGIEVYCTPNIARHQSWDAGWSLYPMFDVAAKFANPSSYAYADGSGDMHVYGAAHYATSAVALVPCTDARPWPNGRQLPDPTF